MEVDGAGLSWVEVNGAGWRLVHGLVIPILWSFSNESSNIYHILDRIHDQLANKIVREEPVPTNFRVAVTVTCCGLAKATVCIIVLERCQVIVDTLCDDTVKKFSDFKQRFPKKHDKIW